MELYNSSTNSSISDNVTVADNFITRSVGLLSKKNISDNEALIIKPCCSVHTFFMKFDIDVVFVDKNNKVVAIREDVKPFRILPIYFSSAYVVEFNAQKISQKILKGDILNLKK